MKEFLMRSHRLLQLPLLLVLFMLVGCENNSDVQPNLSAELESAKHGKSSVHYGPASMVGNGTARVWVEVEHGKPVALGVELSADALENIMSQPMYDISLKLPDQAHSTGFKTITLGWNPEGHEPLGIYTLPHFDLHFYMLTEGQIKQIAGGVDMGALELLEKGVFPPFIGFGPPGADPMAVPHMGVHWVDFTSAEFRPGGVFSKTFIYGSHKDRVTFSEPMFTLDYLLSLNLGEEEIIPVPSLLIHESPGYYANTYTIRHNMNGTYSIALTDLEWHNRHR